MALKGAEIPSFPLATTTTISRAGGSYSSSVRHVQGSDDRIAQKIVFDGDDLLETTETYQYNAYGQVIQTDTEAAMDPQGNTQTRSVRKTLTADGRSVEKEWVHRGVSEQLLLQVNTFDPTLGLPLEVEDAYGTPTRYVYDGLGNVVKTTVDNKHTTEREISWHVGDGSNGLLQNGTSVFKEKTQKTGAPTVYAYLDAHGRTVGVQTWERDQEIWTSQRFDPKGKWEETTVSYFLGQGASAPVFRTTYDDLGRVTSSESRAGITSMSYDGLTTTTTDPTGKTYSVTQNVLGENATIHTPYGSIENHYNPNGTIENIQVQDRILASMEYDDAGVQTILDDPNAGKTQYTYNGFGELLEQHPATGKTINTAYSDGRITSVTRDGGTITYQYVPEGEPGEDQVQKIMGPGFSDVFTYDEQDRMEQAQFVVEGKSFSFEYTYDALDRIQTKTYPNGVVLEYHYHPTDGFLEEIHMNGTLLVKVIETDAQGRVVKYTLGNGLESERSFDPLSGLPTRFYTPGVQDYAMSFDPETANLLWREDRRYGVHESFTYDAQQQQLSLWTVTQDAVTREQGEVKYEDADHPGNITYKSDVSAKDWTYAIEQVHAVGSIQQVYPEVAEKLHGISYNSMQAPIAIKDRVTPESKKIEYRYGATDQRIKSVKTWQGELTERYYLGDYEVTEKAGLRSVELISISFPGIGPVALLETNGGSEVKYHYTYTDHLGTPTTFTDETGAVEFEQAFDPWGRRRKPDTWTVDRTLHQQAPQWAYRGYTGHEMLEEFDLIHMNGRLYDPLVARMLSPDNYVQNPNDPRSYNRFAYAWNNPVKYTDPDGEIAFLAVVGIYAGVNLAADLIRNDGKMNIGEIGISVGLGAVQGALAATGVGAVATGWTVLGSAVASQINIPIYQSDNFNLSVSPSLFAGTNGLRVGASLYGSARFGNTSVGFGYNLGRNFGATDLSGQMAEAKWSSITSWNVGWSNGKHGLSYGASYYGGNYAQSVGNFGFQIGRFSASIENDFLTGSGDKHRSAAVTASYQVNDDLALTAGFSIWTGEPDVPGKGKYISNGIERDCYHSDCEGPSALRNGNWFVGANYRGRSYLAGGNSEGVRATIQNGWHNFMGTKVGGLFFNEASPHFIRMNYQSRFYSSYGTYNPFTIYRQ